MRKPRHFVCAACGTAFSRPRKTAQYCSRVCACKGHALQAQVMKQCYTCGKIFPRIQSRPQASRRYFCSLACQQTQGKYHISERFWRYVDRRGIEECWPWLGGTGTLGHGVFALRRGKTRPAHAVAWELTYGALPEGLQA